MTAKHTFERELQRSAIPEHRYPTQRHTGAPTVTYREADFP